MRQQAPELLGLLGVGPITAAQILVSWSHQGRFRSGAAFAGVSPIPASSGLTKTGPTSHRLASASGPGTPRARCRPQQRPHAGPRPSPPGRRR
ncbi:transposase [Streptomyces sp. NPDC001480]|uniref:transposase n=1 Tax=Streptomyces sp. NPDC001480 TaxID=3364577 RepID=UPI0036A95E1F